MLLNSIHCIFGMAVREHRPLVFNLKLSKRSPKVAKRGKESLSHVPLVSESHQTLQMETAETQRRISTLPEPETVPLSQAMPWMGCVRYEGGRVMSHSDEMCKVRRRESDES